VRQHWQISPLERYAAQLVTDDGFPVVGAAVLLKDGRDSLLWQAQSDNTGKCELWNNLFAAAKGQKAASLQAVVDATGSMGDEIQYLQAGLQDVIAQAKDSLATSTINLGSVFYRDAGDEYVTRPSHLSATIFPVRLHGRLPNPQSPPDQHAKRPLPAGSGLGSRNDGSHRYCGHTSRKVVPWPTSLSTSTRPPAWVMRRLTR